MSEVRIPARFMRGGTSRGPVLRAGDLPADPTERDRLLERMLLGEVPRDGLGGASPTEQKVVLVFDPESDGVVPFQVGSLDAAGRLDWSGTCGNMTATVLPFLAEDGADDSETTVLRNLSTDGLITARRLRPPASGVWEVETAFLDPAGAATGRLLPTGAARDVLEVDGGEVEATIVDIAHPYVFVLRAAFDAVTSTLGLDAAAASERIRGAAAVRAGLAASAATPPPALPRIVVVDEIGEGEEGRLEIRVSAFSMGVAIDSAPVTSALCLAGGAAIPEAVIHVPSVEPERVVVVRAPAGSVVATAVADSGRIVSVGVHRTVRTLMAGQAHVAT